MDGSIQLTSDQRKALLSLYRSNQSWVARQRAHVILLMNGGRSYRDVREVAFVSFDFIAEAVRRFRKSAVDGVADAPSEPEMPPWLPKAVTWLTSKSPQDFGYFRTRWSCETIAELLAWKTTARVSKETVRRWLHRLGFVWRRPRPVLGPVDPERDEKLRKTQELLRTLPANETAVFQDEVDIHLNPKIGSCWMPKGEQAEVVTPGTNVKRHLSGSLVWRTGTLIVSPAGLHRNTDLFLTHLDDLRCRLRSYRVIHVICDNASFHKSIKVREYLKRWGHRIRLHFLPKYAPDKNPIERIWWRLHETITRNHRCQTIDELVAETFEWIEAQPSFYTAALASYAKAA